MTRRFVWIGAALLIGLALPAGDLPARDTQTQKSQKEKSEKQKQGKSEMIKGTILDWNDAAKTFRIKSEAGEEMTFTWNETTQMHGTARAGEKVKVMTKQGDSKVAAQVFVGEEGAGQPEKGKNPKR